MRYIKLGLQLLFLMLFSYQLSGQAAKTPDYTWAHSYNLKKDLAYGQEAAQKLDIYIQGDWVGEPQFFKEDTTLQPTLIYFHGGAWLYQSKDDFLNHQMYVYFMQKGWNVVNVEYRLGEGTAPQAADDVLYALKWISENAAQYHIDLDKIVLSGPSAGGHLALIAGLMNTVPESHAYYVGDKLNIRAIVNWFGASDISQLNDFYQGRNHNSVELWIGDGHTVEDISNKYSPIHYVTEAAPPVISIHGELDSVIPYLQSELLHKKLEQAGTKNQLISLAGGKHLGFTKEQFQLINEQIFKFIGSIMD